MKLFTISYLTSKSDETKTQLLYIILNVIGVVGFAGIGFFLAASLFLFIGPFALVILGLFLALAAQNFISGLISIVRLLKTFSN